MYYLGTSFQVFVIAELLLGVGAAFLSGTLTALTYDILRECGRVNEATKVFGNIQAITLYSSLTAFIIGGFMTIIDLRLPFLSTLITFLIGTAVCSTLREPRFKSDKSKPAYFLLHVKKSITILKSERHLFFLILVMAFMGCLFMMSFWIWQPYLQSIGVATEFFGIIYGLNSIIAALGAHLAYKIEPLLNERKLIIIFPTVLGLSFIGLGLYQSMITAIALIGLQQILKGISNPILITYINKLTPSEVRATIFSIVGLLTRLFFAVLSPIIGFIADSTSISFALIICGFLFSVAPILFLLSTTKLTNKMFKA